MKSPVNIHLTEQASLHLRLESSQLMGDKLVLY